jgi:hypothetical protein
MPEPPLEAGYPLVFRSGRCFTAASVLLAVLRLRYFVVRGREEVAQNSPIILLVLDDENSLAHAGLAGCTIEVETKRLDENFAAINRRLDQIIQMQLAA